MRDAMLARQGLLGQQAKMGAEFESNAEKMRKATEEKNLETLISSVTGVEKFNLDRWKKLKDVEASKAQAEATRASVPSSSCWVISELSKHVKLPKDQGKLLTKMKIYFAIKNLKLSVFYIRKCHVLVDKMNAANFDWVSFKWFNDSLMALLRSGEYEAAASLFKSTVLNLIQEYWPECSDRAYLKAIKEQNDKIEEMESIKSDSPNKLLDFECLSNLPEVNFEGGK